MRRALDSDLSAVASAEAESRAKDARRVSGSQIVPRLPFLKGRPPQWCFD